MKRPLPLLLLSASVLIPSAALAATAATPATSARQYAWAQHPPRPSWALEDMLRERLARGEYVPPGIVERFGLDRPPAWMAEPDLVPGESARPSLPEIEALGLDHIVNDRTTDVGSCAGCSFLLHIQSETTIAAYGPFLLAGWNDSKGFCDNTSVSGWGWSLNNGTTWVDGGGPPPLATGGRYRGDPIHAVNRATGEFYVGALYEGGAMGSGVACLHGRFAGGTFVVDGNREVGLGMANFLDKCWMAVDPLTGRVYVTWTSFTATGDQIELQVLDAALNPIGGVVVVSPPSADGLVQGSRPAVGPNGELYVTWYQYGLPQSEMHIRRSDDFGVTFGADVVVAPFFENGLNGAPGFLREFAPNFPSIAVDMSNGPHRGRVYVAWDETVHFRDTDLFTGPNVNEAENNGFFQSANAFSVGSALNGSLSSGDVDFFRFTGTAGQTFVLGTDAASTPNTIAVRLVCANDTSTFNSYRIQAYTASNAPELCYTLPVSGTYYLRVNFVSGPTTTYRLVTGWDSPSSDERAHHNREKFVAHSDGGATWSTPVRVDDDITTDGIYPELAVDDLGRVWCYWHDFRDDPACGAESYEYVTASGDGGLSWGPNEPLSDARSFWPPNTCRKPNQGDYQGATAIGNRFIACWADARAGDPDTYVEVTTFALARTCAASQLAIAPGTTGDLSAAVKNQGSLTRTIAWSIVSDLGWPITATPAVSGVVTLAPAASQALAITVHPFPDCLGVTDTIRVLTWDPLIPGEVGRCVTAAYCTPPVGVPGAAPASLALSRPLPNPSADAVTFDVTLPRAGFAKVEVFGAGGRRVRTLWEGELGEGVRNVRWDGRDAGGRRVSPGAYWVRLSALGEERAQAVVRVR